MKRKAQLLDNNINKIDRRPFAEYLKSIGYSEDIIQGISEIVMLSFGFLLLSVVVISFSVLYCAFF